MSTHLQAFESVRMFRLFEFLPVPGKTDVATYNRLARRWAVLGSYHNAEKDFQSAVDAIEPVWHEDENSLTLAVLTYYNQGVLGAWLYSKTDNIKYAYDAQRAFQNAQHRENASWEPNPEIRTKIRQYLSVLGYAIANHELSEMAKAVEPGRNREDSNQ